MAFPAFVVQPANRKKFAPNGTAANDINFPLEPWDRKRLFNQDIASHPFFNSTICPQDPERPATAVDSSIQLGDCGLVSAQPQSLLARGVCWPRPKISTRSFQRCQA